jgi:hypothetical protein
MSDRPDYTPYLQKVLKMRELANTAFNMFIYEQHQLNTGEMSDVDAAITALNTLVEEWSGHTPL